jgi:hypothetical protein
MSARAHAQIRRSQAITTWGPGALIDLPRHSGIVGGLETWPKVDVLDEIADPRLTRKISQLTSVPAPRLYAPPAASTAPQEPTRGIGVWRFPEWMLVQEDPAGDVNQRSRRLVHRKSLENDKFDGRQVVPTRFVRACPRGHVSDLNWHWFVHGPDDACRQQLWLDERGTGGDLADLADLVVRCVCGKSRRMTEAAELDMKPLGSCWGARPWLGMGSQEQCGLPSRLLIRTAANAYFPQVMSALSLPEHGTQLDTAVRELWDDLQIVENSAELNFVKKKPKVASKLAGHSDQEILDAITKLKHGESYEQPVKLVELDALLAAPAGYGDDVPIDPDFHARRLPESAWRVSSLTDPVAAVIQLHRLREVLALIGFTRFDAITPDIHGEYDSDVQRAELALDPQWFPAIESRGEGIFMQLDSRAVAAWLARPAVADRIDELVGGHAKWTQRRNVPRPFPGGPYVLLHTLSHLLVQSIAMRCGYPASSIRERIYVDVENARFGLLLYTASSDAEAGTWQSHELRL